MVLIEYSCGTATSLCARDSEHTHSSHCYLGSLSRTSTGPSTSQILGTFLRFSETFLAEREGVGPQGILPRTLGDPPNRVSLSAKTVLREPREGPENLGSRRSWRSEIMAKKTTVCTMCFVSLGKDNQCFTVCFCLFLLA